MGDKNKISLIPKDGQVVLAIIKEMGMIEHEPKTIIQLTDFVYKYVSTVLEEARYFSNNSKKKFVDVEDVQAGLNIMNERNFVSTPSRELSTEQVKAINSTPLPFLKPHCGLRLPQQGFSLTKPNFILSKKAPKKYSAVARPTINVIKPKITYIRHLPTASTSAAQQQSVIVPNMKINFIPTIKQETDVAISNGTLKRKRQD